jgi:phospholipase/lecithinase/hemolysin
LTARTPGRGDTTTLPPETGGNTWAWGGAEAAAGTDQPSGVTEPIPNLLTQVQEYLASNTPRPKTLFAIWSGADNLLVGGQSGPQAAAAAVDAVKTAMIDLEKAGARHLLIFNMPKMGDTPDAQAGGQAAIAAANLYAVSFNAALRAAIHQLRNNRRFKAKIYVVDAFRELARIVDTVNRGRTYKPRFFVPGAPVAINNVTDTGLNYFNANGTYPTNYLFWDGPKNRRKCAWITDRLQAIATNRVATAVARTSKGTAQDKNKKTCSCT